MGTPEELQEALEEASGGDIPLRKIKAVGRAFVVRLGSEAESLRILSLNGFEGTNGGTVRISPVPYRFSHLEIMEKVDQELLGEAHAASCIKGGGGAEKNEVYAVQTAPQSPAPYKSAAPPAGQAGPPAGGPPARPQAAPKQRPPPDRIQGISLPLIPSPQGCSSATPSGVSTSGHPPGRPAPPQGAKGVEKVERGTEVGCKYPQPTGHLPQVQGKTGNPAILGVVFATIGGTPGYVARRQSVGRAMNMGTP